MITLLFDYILDRKPEHQNHQKKYSPIDRLSRADTLILPNSAIRAGMLSTRVPSLSGRVIQHALRCRMEGVAAVALAGSSW